MSGFSRFFIILLRFWGMSREGEFKNKTKNVLPKKRTAYRKVQYRFFPRFYTPRFWASLGEGSSKTLQKKPEHYTLSGPVIFLASDLPTYHRAAWVFFFFGGPSCKKIDGPPPYICYIPDPPTHQQIRFP
jgi:hypothetical protein